MLRFAQEVKAELSKVTFPTTAEVTRLTAVVIAISVLVGGFIGVSDLFFTQLLSFLIK